MKTTAGPTTTARGVGLGSVYATSALFCAIAAVYGLTHVKPSGLITLGLAFGPLLAGAAWVERDARQRRVALVYDWGLFLMITWPVFIAWYAFSTRGGRGVRLIAKLVAALLMPNAIYSMLQ